MPDVEYTQHENTFLLSLKAIKVKLKSDKGRRSRKARRSAGIKSLSLWTLDSLWTISWHLKN